MGNYSYKLTYLNSISYQDGTFALVYKLFCFDALFDMHGYTV